MNCVSYQIKKYPCCITNFYLRQQVLVKTVVANYFESDIVEFGKISATKETEIIQQWQNRSLPPKNKRQESNNSAYIAGYSSRTISINSRARLDGCRFV